MGSGWLVVGVGAAVRGSIRREIEAAAWQRGLEVKTDEAKGLLESVYRFRVSGSDEQVGSFLRVADAWLKRIEEGDGEAL